MLGLQDINENTPVYATIDDLTNKEYYECQLILPLYAAQGSITI